MQSFGSKESAKPPVHGEKIKDTPTLEPRYVARELNEAFKWPNGRAPDALVNAIAETGNPQKIKEAIIALKKLEKSVFAYHKNEFSWMLDNEDIAKMFVNKPSEVGGYLERIAKSAGDGAGEAFLALSEWKISAKFASNPAEITGYFERIAKAAGLGAANAFHALAEGPIADTFAKNPLYVTQCFERIAKAAGMEASPQVFATFGEEHIANMFNWNPTKTIEYIEKLVRAAGKAVREAFAALPQAPIATMFSKNPFEVIGYFERVTKSAGAGAGSAFLLLSKVPVAEKFAKDPSKITEYIESIGKYAGAGANAAFAFLSEKKAKSFAESSSVYADTAMKAGIDSAVAFKYYIKFTKWENMLDTIWSNGEKGNGQMLDIAAGGRLAKEVGADYKDAEICLNFAHAIRVIGEEKAKALYKAFGIEYFARYTRDTLESLYEKINVESNKPVLLVVYNKNDHNGVFYNDSNTLEQLMASNQYNTIIVEVENEDEFSSAVRGVADKYTAIGIEAILIAGHGNPGAITLGGKELTNKAEKDMTPADKKREEYTSLDLTDVEDMKQLKDCFSGEPKIVLWSCSTGRSEGGKKSIGEVISGIWGGTLIAPLVKTSLERIIVDKNEHIVDVAYRGGARIIFKDGHFVEAIPGEGEKKITATGEGEE